MQRAHVKAMAAFCVGLVLLTALYLWRVPVSVAPVIQSDTTVDNLKTIDLTIQTPVESLVLTVDCPGLLTCDLTAFSALQKAVERDTIAMQYKTYDGLGVMITSVAGFENGQDGKYWVYEINGQKIAAAADQQALQFADQLLWKFVTPE